MDDKTLLETLAKMFEAEREHTSQMMDSKLKPINVRLDKVDARLDTMQADITALKAGQDVIQGDVAALKADIATHNHEAVPLLDAIAGTVSRLEEQTNHFHAVEDTVEDHGHRIWALEKAVKAK